MKKTGKLSMVILNASSSGLRVEQLTFLSSANSAQGPIQRSRDLKPHWPVEITSNEIDNIVPRRNEVVRNVTDSSFVTFADSSSSWILENRCQTNSRTGHSVWDVTLNINSFIFYRVQRLRLSTLI